MNQEDRKNELGMHLYALQIYDFKYFYYMAAAASYPNTEILQFDWFISGRIFPVLPAQGMKFKKALLMSNKNKNSWQTESMKWKCITNYLLRIIRKGKVSIQSEVAEKIPYEMTTELQVFTVWGSALLHLYNIFQ